uniref:Uncharacterized protein n=1 Tax=Hyaloperonospora arabidopsidis (strain Emoy2) TaxID=559515 RepID=M4C236_HYAAE
MRSNERSTQREGNDLSVKPLIPSHKPICAQARQSQALPTLPCATSSLHSPLCPHSSLHFRHLLLSLNYPDLCKLDALFVLRVVRSRLLNKGRTPLTALPHWLRLNLPIKKRDRLWVVSSGRDTNGSKCSSLICGQSSD